METLINIFGIIISIIIFGGAFVLNVLDELDNNKNKTK